MDAQTLGTGEHGRDFTVAPLRVLGLWGSLRRASVNRMMIRALAHHAGPKRRVDTFPEIGGLPLFNPDLESDPPLGVSALHRAVDHADGLVICSPEYAHGVTGTIKNALDWLVGYPPFASKPVAIVNMSARARHADAALRETLRTMSARLVGDESFQVPLASIVLDEAALFASEEVRRVAIEVLRALASASD